MYLDVFLIQIFILIKYIKLTFRTLLEKSLFLNNARKFYKTLLKSRERGKLFMCFLF